MSPSARAFLIDMLFRLEQVMLELDDEAVSRRLDPICTDITTFTALAEESDSVRSILREINARMVARGISRRVLDL